VTRRRTSFFSNTIVLPGFDIYEALKIDDPKKVEWKKYLIDLRGRHLERAVLDGATLTRADLTGAFLGETSLEQLQGASLEHTQLQDASLKGARLEGASLENAGLKGASLENAELQGASLENAELQGASLDSAKLWAASLAYAQLQGASFDSAELWAASLAHAQLQGASLKETTIQNVSFEGAFLWRADLGARLEGILAPGADGPSWRPEYWDIADESETRPKAWTDAAYVALQQTIKRAVPEGKQREAALKRVADLDCQRKDDTLASCHPLIKPPPAVREWRKAMERASIDEDTYRKAVATILDELVCSGNPNSIHVLRGVVSSGRIEAVGREALAMIAHFMKSACPVSAALTDDDQVLLAIAKADLEPKDNFAPPGNAAPK
jgi:uncharacterized protein YjbI with pentapeptide repeats